jgi:hypothetical protein
MPGGAGRGPNVQPVRLGMEIESLNADIQDKNLIGHSQPMGEGNRDMRISDIQDQVGRGEYRVDTHAVAEAILRRLLLRAGADESGKTSQGECS